MFEEKTVRVEMGSAKNKNLVIYNKPNTTMFAVRWQQGGELPAALQQLWTSRNMAIAAIDRWTADNTTPPKKKAATTKKVS